MGNITVIPLDKINMKRKQSAQFLAWSKLRCPKQPQDQDGRILLQTVLEDTTTSFPSESLVESSYG